MEQSTSPFLKGDSEVFPIPNGHALRHIPEEDTRLSKSLGDLEGMWKTSEPNSPQLIDSNQLKLEKELLNEKKQRLTLQEQLDHKMKEIRELVMEKKRLEQQVLGKNPSSSSSSSSSSLSSSSKEQKTDLPDDVDDVMGELLEENTRLNMLVEKLERENEEKDKKMRELEAETKRASLASWRTMSDKLNQDVEMEVWRRKFNDLSTQLEANEALLRSKEEELEELRAELQMRNDEAYKMSLKLLEYKSKVSNVELQLRKFAVKRIHRLYPNADVELTLTKNPSNGVISIDVLEKGKHAIRPIKNVQMVQEEESQRFYVHYSDGGTDTFESPSARDIVSDILEVLPY